MLRHKKGQSTLEYIILITGVVAVLLVFLGKEGPFRKSLNKVLNGITNTMEDVGSRLSNSYPRAPVVPPAEEGG